jgi:hypothetical protein
MLSSKYENRMYIGTDAKVNDAGTLVSFRASTSRKATDYDKLPKNGYVYSSWNVRILGKEACKDAKRIKKGDKIVVPPDAFSITNGEVYEEGKFSYPQVQVFSFSFYDGKKSKGNEQEEPEAEEESDIPF